jgi:exosortase
MSTIDAIKTTDRGGLGKRIGSLSHGSAITLWLLSLILFRQPLNSLVALSFSDERASHILLIPLISAVFMILERKRIFHSPRYCPEIGLPLLLLPIALWYGLTPHLSSLHSTDGLSVIASLIVLTWIGAFFLCYGSGSVRSAAFPLLFLLLMIPLPVAAAEYTVSVLQRGSAEICYFLFRLLGVPFIRHGFQFSLPGVDIEVAEQCSGIHSGLSLLIAGLVAQHLLLQGPWRKICFTLCILPIAILKNAVRIVTISWLGIHVNPEFFHGSLHRQGGLPFSLLAVALMGALLWVMRAASGCLRASHAAEGRKIGWV